MEGYYSDRAKWVAWPLWCCGYCSKNPPEWAFIRMREVDEIVKSWEINNRIQWIWGFLDAQRNFTNYFSESVDEHFWELV